jgi:hypothetical protein
MPMSSLTPGVPAAKDGCRGPPLTLQAVAATLGNTPTEGDRSTTGTEVRTLARPKTPVS